MKLVFFLIFISSGVGLTVTIWYLSRYRIWIKNKGYIGRIFVGSIFGMGASIVLCQGTYNFLHATLRDGVIGGLVCALISIFLISSGINHFKHSNIGEINRLLGYIEIIDGVTFLLIGGACLIIST